MEENCNDSYAIEFLSESGLFLDEFESKDREDYLYDKNNVHTPMSRHEDSEIEKSESNDDS